MQICSPEFGYDSSPFDARKVDNRTNPTGCFPCSPGEAGHRRRRLHPRGADAHSATRVAVKPLGADGEPAGPARELGRSVNVSASCQVEIPRRCRLWRVAELGRACGRQPKTCDISKGYRLYIQNGTCVRSHPFLMLRARTSETARLPL
jgi:hypothetical protein